MAVKPGPAALWKRCLRAERARPSVLLGEMLKATERAKGAKGNPGGQGAKIVRSSIGTAQHTPTLADLNLSKKESAAAQREGRRPRSCGSASTLHRLLPCHVESLLTLGVFLRPKCLRERGGGQFHPFSCPRRFYGRIVPWQAPLRDSVSRLSLNCAPWGLATRQSVLVQRAAVIRAQLDFLSASGFWGGNCPEVGEGGIVGQVHCRRRFCARRWPLKGGSGKFRGASDAYLCSS